MRFNSSNLVASTVIIAGLMAAYNPTSALAQNAGINSSIKLYFSGIRVGKLKSVVALSRDKYSISGKAESSSVVSVIKKTKASFSSSGTLSGRSVLPESQSVTYKSGKDAGKTTLSFKDGNVIAVKASPKIKYKSDSVEVTRAHFKKVLDPVTSLIFPVTASQIGNGNAICNRTIPLFNGKSRLNLKFGFKSRQVMSTKGFSGEVFTCNVKYLPVSGHRTSSKTTAFMMKNNDIEVSFARIGSSNVYGLYGFTVPIRRGTVTGVASKFKSF